MSSDQPYEFIQNEINSMHDDENVRRGIRNSLILRATSEGYSVQEVAERMGLDVATVKKVVRGRVNKARQIRQSKNRTQKQGEKHAKA